MTKMKAEVRSYWAAQTFLGGKDERKIGHNTWIVSTPTGYGIKYHNTVVITYFVGAEKVYMNTNGWHTITTKLRMNLFLPSGYSIHQEKHEWWLNYKVGEEWRKRPYDDCMTIPVDPEKLEDYS